VARWQSAFVEHRWDDLPAFYADDIVHDDRRRLVGNHAEGAAEFDFERRRPSLEDLGVTDVRTTVIAIRGDQLSITRETYTYQDAYELDMFRLIEINDRGQMALSALFDPDDLADAMTLLDDRYEATLSPGVRESFRLGRISINAYNSGDMSVFAGLLADGFEVVMGHHLGVTHDREMSIRLLGVQDSSKFLYTRELFVLDEHGSVARMHEVSRNDTGGELDAAAVAVTHTAAGQIRRIEFFPEDQLDAALARYAELTAPRANLLDRLLDNAAARVGRRYADVIVRGDLDALAAMLSEDHMGEDRRAGLTTRFFGRAARLEAAAQVPGLGITAIDVEPVAVRGEQLVLTRGILHAEEGEIRMLVLLEIDDAGLISRIVNFDEGDMEGAIQELDARLVALLPPREAAATVIGDRFNRAQRAGDAEAMAACLADDFVFVDHQLLANEFDDGGAFVDVALRRTELTSQFFDVVTYYVSAPHGGVAVATEVGVLTSGGDFEVPRVSLFTVRGGKINRIELFHQEQFDAALARLEELRPSLLENRAVRSMRRMSAAVEAQDAHGVVAGMRPDFLSVDHRNLERGVESNRDEWREVAAHLFELGLRRLHCTPIAVRGESLALVRLDYLGRRDDGFRSTLLSVVEVDDADNLRTIETFDEADLPAACTALEERAVAVFPPEVRSSLRVGISQVDAMHSRDGAALRAVLSEDFESVDHRALGMGVRKREEWIASTLEATVLATNTFDLVEWVHAEPHGIVHLDHVTGLVGGGDVEIRCASLMVVRDGRVARMESFAEDDLDLALARLEELRPSLLENRAVWCRRRMAAAVEAQDVDRLVAEVRDDFVSVDHRGLEHGVEYGRDEWREGTAVLFDLGLRRLECTPIAVRGENLALVRLEYVNEGDDPFTSVVLSTVEVDDDGRARRFEMFNEDDLPAAYRALHDRALTLFPPEVADATLVGYALIDAFGAGDGETLHALLADDFESVDHRALGLGVRTRDEWIASALGATNLTSGLFDVLEWLHPEPHGSVWLIRRTGLVAGGEVENRFAGLLLVRDGRVARMESFAEGEVDLALVRLSELGRS